MNTTAFFTRWWKAVVAFWLVVALLSVGAIAYRFVMRLPIIDNSVGIWFLSDDPDLISYQEHNTSFDQREWSLILLQGDNIWDPAFLAALDSTTRELKAVPHVWKVVSLTNARDSRLAADSALEYVPLWNPDLAPEQRAASLREKATTNPILRDALLRPSDTTRVGILLLADNLINDPSPYRIEIVDSVRTIAARHPLIREVHFAGTTVVNAELNRSAGKDAILFYILVTLLVVVVGYLALRTVRDLLIVLAVIAISILVPMGLLAALDIPYNMVTIMLPPILVALSVCDIIHIINGFHIQRREHSVQGAIEAGVANLFVSCVWTTVVTVIGFLSMIPSTVNPIRQLGIYASVGLAVALFVTLSLGPALLFRFWKASEGRTATRKGMTWRAGQYAEKLYPRLFGPLRWVWIGLGFACFLPIWGIAKLEVDTDYTKFFSPKAPLSRAYAAIDSAGWGQSLISVDIRAPHADSLLGSNWRARTIRLESELAKLPMVKKTLSFNQILRRVDDAWSGGSDSARFSSYSPEQLRNLHFLADLSGNDDLADFVNAGGTLQQVLVLTPYQSSKELVAFSSAVDSLARSIMPSGAKVSIEGTPVLWANMDQEISKTQVMSFVALAIVFMILLPLMFRSITLGFIGVMINGLPLCMTFGVMGLLGVKVNIATALIGGVSIGSTVDSTIFFINRFRRGIAEGLGWDAAIRVAVLEVGDGILVTSLLLAGGFFCMSTSSFLPTAHFGIFTTFTVVTAVFLDIIIDPIVLTILGRWKRFLPSPAPGRAVSAENAGGAPREALVTSQPMAVSDRSEGHGID